VINTKQGWFVTGTDTDVGKTVISTALVDWLSQRGTACGYKPVAAGCDRIDGDLRNADALALQAASQPRPDYTEINPIALEAAIAPHIAAAQAGGDIHLPQLASNARGLQENYQFVVAEGAGGWLVPLNQQQTFADLAVELGYPVILVVAIRLGCINHALLTANAIENSGLPLAGWVANCIQADMPALEENINSLKQRLAAPLLGILPKLDKLDTATIQQHIGFQTLVS
jgi:dethiobiotin synthetase